MVVSVATAAAIFFLIWWITLFVVLPWGVRSQHENEQFAPGTDPGAPVIFMLGRKLLWTTVAAAVVFAALYGVYVAHLISLNALMHSLELHFVE